MGHSSAGISWRWAGGGLAATCLLAVAVGAPLVGYSTPFSMPMGTPPKEIWGGPAGNRVAAKVSVGSGSVKVNGTVGSTSKLLSPLSAGLQCVFEGGFDKLTLEGVTLPAEGAYETRLMSQHTASDRVVGSGSISFPASGGLVGFYSSDQAARRLASISVSGGSIAIRSTRTGNDLVTVDDGDWSCAIVGSATGFFLSTAAPATGAYSIQDVSVACGPFTGSAKGQSGDYDSLSLDGTCPVVITLTNAGPAAVTVTHVIAGTPTNGSVPAGSSMTCSGNVSSYIWTYSGTQTTVNLSVSVQ